MAEGAAILILIWEIFLAKKDKKETQSEYELEEEGSNQYEHKEETQRYPQEFSEEELETEEYLTPGERSQLPASKQKEDTFFELLEKKIGLGGKKIAISVIVVIVLIALAFAIFINWVSARFKFIWLRTIIGNDASIAAPWREYQREGNSLFKFFLGLMVVVCVIMGLFVWWAWTNASSVGLFDKGSPVSIWAVLKAFGPPTIIFISGILFLMILGQFIEQFVVAVMGVERCQFVEAWHKSIGFFASRKLELALFFLVCIGLGIASGIIAGIIAIICVLVMLVAGALLLGVPYLLIAMWLKLLPLYIIYAILVGIPFFVAVLLLFVGIYLPFSVFFRCFSLYFLSAVGYGHAPLALIEEEGTQSQSLES